jgi:hypothetical protein
MSSTGGALCGKHPQVSAVEVCTRCGSFLCGECVDYLNETAAYCEPCLTLVTAKTSTRAKVSLALAVLGVLGMVAGWVLIGARHHLGHALGRAGLGVWAGAMPAGLLGLATSLRELRAITSGAATSASRPVAALARTVGVLHAALVLALLVAFLRFVTQAGGQ